VVAIDGDDELTFAALERALALPVGNTIRPFHGA
jgi:hypothetical protein